MSLLAERGSGNDIEPISIGVHPAILIWIVDLGEQETPWGWKRRVMLTFEFPKEVLEIKGEGFKPRIHSEEISPFIFETSNLGKYLEGWFGKLPDADFPLSKLSGKHCMVNIAHKKNGYPKIASITPPTDECKELEATNDIVVYELGKGQPLSETIPEWIRVKVMKSREWNEQGQMNDEPPQEPSGAPF